MEKILYRAKVRAPGQMFWKTYKNVSGDAIEHEIGIRWLLLVDGTMIYIPLQSEVVFSKERDISIRDQMSAEAGTQVK